MNWTIIIIETIVLTLAFTAMILIPLVKNPVWWIADYPEDIQEEYFKTHERIPSKFFSPTVLLKKGMALLIALALLLVVVKLAGAYDFWSALGVGYGIWLFIDWYDCFFLDWVLFANMKKVRLPGTEHMDEAYHQKKYHFMQSCWGMLIGLIPCLIGAGLYAWLLCGKPDTQSLAIREAIEQQLETYPESTLQDVYKSFYQDRFGPGHMITDTASVRQYLLDEFAENDVASEVYFEPTGSEGRFVRVYLSAVADSLITAEQLFDAFIQSANAVQEPQTDWASEWESIVDVIRKNNLKVNDFESQLPLLNEAAQNNQAVHHSQAYREAYHPHYRIVEREVLQKVLPKK